MFAGEISGVETCPSVAQDADRRSFSGRQNFSTVVKNETIIKCYLMFILNIVFEAALRHVVFGKIVSWGCCRRSPGIVAKFEDLPPFVAQ
jgi:hypothetical protein